DQRQSLARRPPETGPRTRRPSTRRRMARPARLDALPLVPQVTPPPVPVPDFSSTGRQEATREGEAPAEPRSGRARLYPRPRESDRTRRRPLDRALLDFGIVQWE